MSDPIPEVAFTYTVEGMTFRGKAESVSGDAVYWQWEYGDLMGDVTPEVEHEYFMEGDFNVTLTGYDVDHNKSWPHSEKITVSRDVTPES